MEQNYTVSYKIHDTKNNSWSNAFVSQYDEYWTAVAKYGSEIARLINAQDYDFVLIQLQDTYGNIVQSIFRDSRVAPEPNEE